MIKLRLLFNLTTSTRHWQNDAGSMEFLRDVLNIYPWVPTKPIPTTHIPSRSDDFVDLRRKPTKKRRISV